MKPKGNVVCLYLMVCQLRGSCFCLRYTCVRAGWTQSAGTLMALLEPARKKTAEAVLVSKRKKPLSRRSWAQAARGQPARQWMLGKQVVPLTPAAPMKPSTRTERRPAEPEAATGATAPRARTMREEEEGATSTSPSTCWWTRTCWPPRCWRTSTETDTWR